MEATQKKERAGGTMEPPGQDGLPHGSTDATPVRAFVGSKSTASSGPDHTTESPESKPAVTAAMPASAAKMVRLQEGQLRHVQLEPVGLKPFREEKSAPGKIAFNEDAMTPVFSFYTGRIVRLL